MYDVSPQGTDQSPRLSGRVSDSWSKGLRFKSQREWWKNFLLMVIFLFWLLLQYSIRACVTAAACKRSRSFCQKCRWQVQLNMHVPCLQPNVIFTAGWMLTEIMRQSQMFHSCATCRLRERGLISKSVYVCVFNDLELLRYVLRCAIEWQL